MAVICPYNTKCQDCRHHRHDKEEDRMACFYAADSQTNKAEPDNNNEQKVKTT